METPELIFSQTVEGLFLRALGSEVTPTLRATLSTLGVDLDRLLPAYPLDVWNRALRAAADALYPQLPTEEAAKQLGMRTVQGYQSTLIGQATFAFARLIGPRRTLLRAKQNWRSGNNYTEVVLTERGPTDFLAVFNERGLSRFASQGVLQAGLEFAGARELVVTIEKLEQRSVTYAVKWRT